MSDKKRASATAPVTPEAPKATKAPKGVDAVEEHADEATATTTASGRTKGAYRAFKVTHNGATKYFTANHHHFLGQKLLKEMGVEIGEIGKTPRASGGAKPLSIDAIMAALNAMPEVEKAAILKQVEALKAK